jgi:hypothetical protein
MRRRGREREREGERKMRIIWHNAKDSMNKKSRFGDMFLYVYSKIYMQKRHCMSLGICLFNFVRKKFFLRIFIASGRKGNIALLII